MVEPLQFDEQTQFNGIKVITSDSILEGKVLIVGDMTGPSFTEKVSEFLWDKDLLDREIKKRCAIITNIK